MRNRAGATDVLLMGAVLMWALNLPVTKYILTHGLEPLPYTTVRYGLAGVIFVGLTIYAERTLRVEGRHLPLLALAAGLLWLNQLSFVFAVDLTTASTIGLVLGAIPVFAALFYLLGTERPTGRFWIAAAMSVVGVALVAAGSGGEVSGELGGSPRALDGRDLGGVLGRGRAADAASYSAVRVSAVVIPLAAWVLIALTGIPQTRPGLGSAGAIWPLLVGATLGPLVLTNVLWFRSIAPDRPDQGDARREPPAVRRRGARSDPAPRRAAERGPDRGCRRADRARHPRRPAPRARPPGRRLESDA